MSAALAIARKDLRLLLRDKAGFFFAFIFPVIYATFFGMIFSRGGGDTGKLSVVVADDDRSPESRAFVESLRKAAELEVSTASSADAEELVRAGRRTAYVELPAGFGAARRRMFWGEPPKMIVGVDPSHQAEGGMLQGLLMREFMQNWQQSFTNPAFMKTQIADTIKMIDSDDETTRLSSSDRTTLKTFLGSLDQFMASPVVQKPASSAPATSSPTSASTGGYRGFEPVKIDVQQVVGRKRASGPTNFFAVSFPQGMIWGVMGCAAGFGISLVAERSKGTLTRLRMSAIAQHQILLGKALACFATIIGVCVFMLLFAVFVFGVRPTSPALLAVSIVSVGAGFVGIMMLLAVLGRTEQSAGGIGWAILLVMAMIGGGMIPAFVMPAWMQRIGTISPVYWAIRALEGPLWRDDSTQAVLQPCGILIAVGIGCFAIGATVFHSIERR